MKLAEKFRNCLSILLWRKFFLFSVVIVVVVGIIVVEVVARVASVVPVGVVSVGVVIKCSISLSLSLGNNMFRSYSRGIWVITMSVWVGISVWVLVASVSSCWVSSIYMWVYSMMCIWRVGVVKKSGIRTGISLSFALGNNMGNGVLVIVVGEDAMVVVWVNGVRVNQVLLGLFNSFQILVMLLGEFDGVGLFRHTRLGHTLGMMRVDVFDDGHNRIYERYSQMMIEELGVSLWLSKSDCHKGEQSNKAEHG